MFYPVNRANLWKNQSLISLELVGFSVGSKVSRGEKLLFEENLKPVKEAKQLHLHKLTLNDPPFKHGNTEHEPVETVSGAAVVTEVSQN